MARPIGRRKPPPDRGPGRPAPAGADFVLVAAEVLPRSKGCLRRAARAFPGCLAFTGGGRYCRDGRAGGEDMGATARRISHSRGRRTPARSMGFAMRCISKGSLALLLGLLAPAGARAEVRRLAFPVSGMHSPLATRGVEEAIRQLPGVARVSADLGSGRVEVEAENLKSLNLQEVRTRAARAGFPVSGDLDIQARGRFDTGVDGRITFKVSGTTYAWQVLESGTLLEIIRSHPGLKGDFVAGFRLFEKPAWNHPSISLTGWEAIPAPVAAAPGPPANLRPAPEGPAGSKTGQAKPATKPAAGQAKPATDKAKPAATKSTSAKPAPAKATAATSKKKATDSKQRKDPQDPEKP